jgi:hypothetical protein
MQHMGIDNVNYHGWHGRLRSPWLSCLAIVRVALLQVLRRKSYWLVLGLGLLHFVFIWAVIYAVTQLDLPPRAEELFTEAVGFSAEGNAIHDSGYIQFMNRQNIPVMMLLAFSGSLIVGSDFRLKSLPFFLSRRIDRRHYIVGKLLAVSAVIVMITVLPALLLFIEYGAFTSSFDYWFSNWKLVGSILGYGAVMCVVLSIWLVALSAYLQRMAPIAITWASLFVLSKLLVRQLMSMQESEYWVLLDPWHNIQAAGRLCFGVYTDRHELDMAWASFIILAVVTTFAMCALVHRVRAVDIVN